MKSLSLDVILNVYDLMDNTYLYPIGLGAYHSGVVIFEREYTFSESGVFYTMPKNVEAQFRTSIPMGRFTGSIKDFEIILNSIKKEFPPGTYDLYTKNCNSFSNAFCQKLVNKSIPAWINRMAGIGGSFQNIFGKNGSGQAPVTQNGASGYTPSSGSNASNYSNVSSGSYSSTTGNNSCYASHSKAQPPQNVNQNQSSQQPLSMSREEMRQRNQQMAQLRAKKKQQQE